MEDTLIATTVVDEQGLTIIHKLLGKINRDPWQGYASGTVMLQACDIVAHRLPSFLSRSLATLRQIDPSETLLTVRCNFAHRAQGYGVYVGYDVEHGMRAIDVIGSEDFSGLPITEVHNCTREGLCDVCGQRADIMLRGVEPDGEEAGYLKFRPSDSVILRCDAHRSKNL